MTSPAPIYTSAVVFTDVDGRILTARKRGTKRFMLVGGKPEPGEQPRQTALREIREEVGLLLMPEDLELIGMWRTAAANESGRDVHGTAFVVREPITELPRAAAEIAELRWLDPASALPDDLAPLLQTRILPALAGEVHPWDTDHLPAEEFAYPGPLRDQLVAAIQAGAKTATSSLHADYLTGGEPLPRVGQLGNLVDSEDQPVGVIETTAVDIVPIGSITEQFAFDEGEGFESVAQWRAAHEEFWGYRMADDELVVCEYFRYYRS